MKRLVGLLSIFFLVCLPAIAQSQNTIRVNAGGPSYRDVKGQLWSADYGYNTGELSSSARNASVFGSSDPTLFESARVGTRSGEDLQYRFAVANGNYKVTLYFAETIFTKPGIRVFDVQMEGKAIWGSLDIFAQAGANHALVKSAQVSVTDGELVVRFVHHANANFPIVSAIEILPVAKASGPPTAKLPATPSISPGQMTKLEVVAASTTALPDPSQKEGVVISAATPAARGMAEALTAANSEISPVESSNSVGGATSNVLTPAVLSSPVITTQPASRTVAEGQKATFSVLAGGTAPLSYQWLKNGAAISGATAASYTTPQVTSAENGSTFQVEIKNSVGSLKSASATLTVTVPLAFKTSTLYDATFDKAYSTTLEASGGSTPYKWSIFEGALPSGMTINATTGTISGTPTRVGSYSFTVKVTDSTNPTTHIATKLFSIVVEAAPVEITTSSLAAGRVGVAYYKIVEAADGTAPYKWNIIEGALPPGLTLSATGTISGTPTKLDSYSFTVKVTDSTKPTPHAATKLFSIAVETETIDITTSSLAAGQVGVAYSKIVEAADGTAPYKWSISAGVLPTGLTLSPTTGTISGTPTKVGSYSFTVEVTDSTKSTPHAATKSLTIAVVAAPVEITTSSLTSGQVGVAYSRIVEATYGTTPYEWSISAGALPPGLALSATTGTISGTPTNADSYSFTVKVTDSTAPTTQTATKSFTIAVAAAATPVKITTMSLPSGQVGVVYATTMAATGGTSPYSWSVTSGALPGGLSLTAATGAISGTPTTSGTSAFTVQVTDSGSPATKNSVSFNVTIAAGSGYSVLLAWTASPTSGVTGYNVYRSQENGSGYAKINPAHVAGLTYTDATVAEGQTYYYVTTSVDSSGTESAYSEQVEVTIP